MEEDVPTFDEQDLKRIGALVDRLKNERGQSEWDGKENIGEVMANLILACRHIEDASMRISKVKQHLNGGVSVYDKNVVGSPEK